jgi:hypothetical protein
LFVWMPDVSLDGIQFRKGTGMVTDALQTARVMSRSRMWLGGMRTVFAEHQPDSGQSPTYGGM